ncbi:MULTISPECIES: hypothetical protein [unclassified Rhizobium]|nr:MULTISPECIES: hypothetical protein [unclassified Rhizobium]
MAIAMMIASAVISIVFLADFATTIFQLQRDRAALKMNDTGFQV